MSSQDEEDAKRVLLMERIQSEVAAKRLVLPLSFVAELQLVDHDDNNDDEKEAKKKSSSRKQRSVILHDVRQAFLDRFLVSKQFDVEESYELFRQAAERRLHLQLDETPLFPSFVHVRGYDIEAVAAVRHKINYRLILPNGESLVQDDDDAKGEFIIPQRNLNTHIERIAQHFHTASSWGWHKWDKEGRPVYIERIGQMRAEELTELSHMFVPPGQSFTEPCVWTHTYTNDLGLALLRYQNHNKLRQNQPLLQGITGIMDLRGLGMAQIAGPCVEVMKAIAKIDEVMFPEQLNKAYLVNAPTLIWAFWKVFQHSMDPRTRRKVFILGEGKETEKALKEAIDEEHLPVFLGGKCTCPNECLPEMRPLGLKPVGNVSQMLTVPSGKKHMFDLGIRFSLEALRSKQFSLAILLEPWKCDVIPRVEITLVNCLESDKRQFGVDHYEHKWEERNAFQLPTSEEEAIFIAESLRKSAAAAATAADSSRDPSSPIVPTGNVSAKVLARKVYEKVEGFTLWEVDPKKDVMNVAATRKSSSSFKGGRRPSLVEEEEKDHAPVAALGVYLTLDNTSAWWYDAGCKVYVSLR